MKKITIIDSVSSRHYHEIFNSILLIECLTISDKITYYSSDSAQKALKYIIDDKILHNVSFKTIPVVARNSKLRSVLHYMLGVFICCFLLFKIKKDTIAFYNNVNPFSLSFINFFNKFLKRNVAMFCHGELEWCFGEERNPGILEKMCAKSLNNFFTSNNTRLSDDIMFLVLGDNIKNNLKKHISSDIYNKLYSIDHPNLEINKSLPKINKKNKTPLNIGLVGSVRKTKGGTFDFISLAKILSQELLNEKLKLSVVGSVNVYQEELKSAGVNIPEGFLSREEYGEKIAELDYILFVYGKDSYKYIASGALFEALLAEKPIIALKNDYFEYIFKKYGEFGILLDSIDEMAELIKKLIAGEKLPDFNFKSIKEKLSIENQAQQLKLIFEKEGFLK